MGEMNVRTGLFQESIPVRAFVSIVSRTKRNITKLVYRPALRRVRLSYRTISSRRRNVKQGRGGGAITYDKGHGNGNENVCQCARD
jgi:hypothetical protein